MKRCCIGFKPVFVCSVLTFGISVGSYYSAVDLHYLLNYCFLDKLLWKESLFGLVVHLWVFHWHSSWVALWKFAIIGSNPFFSALQPISQWQGLFFHVPQNNNNLSTGRDTNATMNNESKQAHSRLSKNNRVKATINSCCHFVFRVYLAEIIKCPCQYHKPSSKNTPCHWYGQLLSLSVGTNISFKMLSGKLPHFQLLLFDTFLNFLSIFKCEN